MDAKRIIMNYTVPPGISEFEVLAAEIVAALPDEISEFIEDIAIQIEDFPDDAIQADYDLDDPYEMFALYRSGKELSPGIEKKTANDDDVLILFRRPVLDLWCESCEDLAAVIRDVIIEEIGKSFDFSEDEIDEMSQRHYQGML